jgi:RNA polymerase primary sigma factor
MNNFPGERPAEELPPADVPARPAELPGYGQEVTGFSSDADHSLGELPPADVPSGPDAAALDARITEGDEGYEVEPYDPDECDGAITALAPKKAVVQVAGTPAEYEPVPEHAQQARVVARTAVADQIEETTSADDTTTEPQPDSASSEPVPQTAITTYDNGYTKPLSELPFRAGEVDRSQVLFPGDVAASWGETASSVKEDPVAAEADESTSDSPTAAVRNVEPVQRDVGSAMSAFKDRYRDVALLKPEEEVDLAMQIEAGRTATEALEGTSLFDHLSRTRRMKPAALSDVLAEEQAAGAAADEQELEAKERARTATAAMSGESLADYLAYSRGIDGDALPLSLEHEQAAGMQAREHFILANGDLLMWTLVHKTSGELPLEDRFRAALRGLQQAADRFDPYSGFKFSTYAVKAMTNEVVRELVSQAFDFSLPEKAGADMLKVRYALLTFISENNRDPTNEELAGIVEMSPGRVNELIEVGEQVYDTVRLDMSIDGDANEDPISSILPDDKPGPEEVAIRQVLLSEARSVLMEAMDGLTINQREIFEMTLGLRGERPMTGVEIARQLGRSSQAVQATILRIHERLRMNPRLARIAGELLDT